MSFLGFGKKRPEANNLEEDAFLMIMEIITLARSGKPYRHMLPMLRDRADKFPRIALLIKGLADNLQAGLPRSKR